MTCVHSSSSASSTAPLCAATLAASAALAATLLLTSAAHAQQPPSSSVIPLSVPAMHAPVLQLVQPPPNGSVPTDRPVVFFRYGPGEPTDPIDDGSFQVWVDRAERTARFRIGNGEAWGTLGAPPAASPIDSASRGRAPGGVTRGEMGTQLSAGAHLVTARVCSVRGVCSTSHDILMALPTAAAPPDDTAKPALQAAAENTKRRHSHLKQPYTLLGDLVSNIGKLLHP